MKIRNVDFDFDILRAADRPSASSRRPTPCRTPPPACPRTAWRHHQGHLRHAGRLPGRCAGGGLRPAPGPGRGEPARDAGGLQEVLNAVTAAQKELQSFGVAQTVAGVDVKAPRGPQQPKRPRPACTRRSMPLRQSPWALWPKQSRWARSGRLRRGRWPSLSLRRSPLRSRPWILPT